MLGVRFLQQGIKAEKEILDKLMAPGMDDLISQLETDHSNQKGIKGSPSYLEPKTFMSVTQCLHFTSLPKKLTSEAREGAKGHHKCSITRTSSHRTMLLQ